VTLEEALDLLALRAQRMREQGIEPTVRTTRTRRAATQTRPSARRSGANGARARRSA
jgi:hypothetical protein